MMDVSIIVPAYNAEETLGACLQSLIEQRVDDGLGYEIIVINDDSADNTLTVAQTIAAQSPIPIRIISEGKLGKSGTRNRGAQIADSDILLFTDADCVPTTNWLTTMLAPFRDPDVIGLKGAYLTEQTALLSRFVQVEHEERYERMAQLLQIDFIDTYSAGYRRDVFLENGGFDEQLTNSYVEDQEFSFRLAAAGYKMVFVPGARVYHRHVTSVRRYFWRKFAIASWKALIVQRHPDRFVSDSRTPQMLKVQMLLFLLMLPALIFPPLLGMLAVAFVLSCVPFLQLVRRRDPALIFVSILYLFVRAAALSLGYIDGMIRWRGKKGQAFVGNVASDSTIRPNFSNVNGSDRESVVK